MNTVKEPNDNSGWGGPWTEKKLDAVNYEKAHLTVMHKYPKHKTIYFFQGRPLNRSHLIFAQPPLQVGKI